MKRCLPARWMVPVLLLTAQPAWSQETADTYYREWIDYRDGEISMAFDQTPVEFALDAIRVRTGLQIIIPLARANRLLSLQLERAPLEPAVRSFISTIGFKNFALMYDADGQPNRAVVLTASEEDDRRVAAQSQDAQTKEPISQPLTAAEQEKIHKELERWSDLKSEERGRIEDRLKNLPPSQERELLIAEYGRQLLGVKE